MSNWFSNNFYTILLGAAVGMAARNLDDPYAAGGIILAAILFYRLIHEGINAILQNLDFLARQKLTNTATL